MYYRNEFKERVIQNGQPYLGIDNSSLITHHSSLITHHSSLITHPSSLITHYSSLITHHSFLITTALISTLAFFGKPITATVSLAGAYSGKYSA